MSCSWKYGLSNNVLSVLIVISIEINREHNFQSNLIYIYCVCVHFIYIYWVLRVMLQLASETNKSLLVSLSFTVCPIHPAFVPQLSKPQYIYIYIGLVVKVFHQWSGRPGFNLKSSHIKDSKKWYLIPLCLTVGIIRNVSRVKWCNPWKE